MALSNSASGVRLLLWEDSVAFGLASCCVSFYFHNDMKNWRTALGGSLETLGTGIRDLSTIGAIMQAGTSGTGATTMNLWLIVSGSIICMIGKFFSNLFAADNASVQRAFADHAEQIKQIKEDTNPPFKP